jgi:ABC-type antimicrobial peptide transport system permease subunit
MNTNAKERLKVFMLYNSLPPLAPSVKQKYSCFLAPAILTEVLHDFSQSLKENAGIVP